MPTCTPVKPPAKWRDEVKPDRRRSPAAAQQVPIAPSRPIRGSRSDAAIPPGSDLVLCSCLAIPEICNELRECSSRCWELLRLCGQRRRRRGGCHVWHNQHGPCHVEDGAPALGEAHQLVDAGGGAEHEREGVLGERSQHQGGRRRQVILLVGWLVLPLLLSRRAADNVLNRNFVETSE
jgi:hypothetical protein